jgi:predicted dehydrogenase
MKNKKGQTASLHSSATLWKHTFALEMILEEGYATVEGFLSKTGSYGREQLIVGKRQFEDEAHAVGNPEEEITYFDRDLSWDLEVRELLDCIDNDKLVQTSSSQDALKVMKIIEKAYVDSQTYEEAKR